MMTKNVFKGIYLMKNKFLHIHLLSSNHHLAPWNRSNDLIRGGRWFDAWCSCDRASL